MAFSEEHEKRRDKILVKRTINASNELTLPAYIFACGLAEILLLWVLVLTQLKPTLKQPDETVIKPTSTKPYPEQTQPKPSPNPTQTQKTLIPNLNPTRVQPYPNPIHSEPKLKKPKPNLSQAQSHYAIQPFALIWGSLRASIQGYIRASRA